MNFPRSSSLADARFVRTPALVAPLQQTPADDPIIPPAADAFVLLDSSLGGGSPTRGRAVLSFTQLSLRSLSGVQAFVRRGWQMVMQSRVSAWWSQRGSALELELVAERLAPANALQGYYVASSAHRKRRKAAFQAAGVLNLQEYYEKLAPVVAQANGHRAALRAMRCFLDRVVGPCHSAAQARRAIVVCFAGHHPDKLKPFANPWLADREKSAMEILNLLMSALEPANLGPLLYPPRDRAPAQVMLLGGRLLAPLFLAVYKASGLWRQSEARLGNDANDSRRFHRGWPVGVRAAEMLGPCVTSK